MDKYILGIHGGLIGHDPNICLLNINSNEFLHIEEERISRKKHGPPKEKILNCITVGNNFQKFIEGILGISWDKIEFIVYSRDHNCHPNQKNIYKQELELHKPLLENINNIELNKKMFMFEPYVSNSTFLNKSIYFLNHHIAHGAYSYFTSPFKKSIIFSYDGIGYEESYAMSMIGNDITLSDFRDYPKLFVGFWYHFLTNAIFKSFNKDCSPAFWEGKTMALAGYGSPIYLEAIKDKIYVKGDPFRSFDENKLKVLNRSLNGVSDLNSLKQFHESLLGVISEEKDTFSFLANIANSWQTYLEDLISECMIMLRDHYDIMNLCICGGCGLNGMINYKINKNFNNVYIPPATSDCGNSIGCALYGKHIILGKEKCNYGNIAFKGMNYEINEKLFDKYGVKGEKIEYNELYKLVATNINNDKIVGWYQGRSESGPRALGNRSILANPTKKYIKDKLNYKIKHREWFRPFAPSIMKEFITDYFYDVKDEQYMLKIAKVKEYKLNVIPSAVHIDGTGRVQTVSIEDNEHFYNLIKEFYNITGVPILLNTSFNINGEPIVETPEDALKVFISTDLDILVLKNYIIRK